MIPQNKLYPCPFCGGEAEYERPGTGRHSCQIACTECGAHLETGEVEWSSGMQWNSRWKLIQYAKKKSAPLLLGKWSKKDGKDFFEVQMGFFEKASECWYTADHKKIINPEYYMEVMPPLKRDKKGNWPWLNESVQMEMNQ